MRLRGERDGSETVLQKIRDTEAKIADAFPVVESCETPDGGTSGRLTEVTQLWPRKLIVEGAGAAGDGSGRGGVSR